MNSPMRAWSEGNRNTRGLLHNLACDGPYRNALIKAGEQNLSLGQTLSLLRRARSSRIVPLGQEAAIPKLLPCGPEKQPVQASVTWNVCRATLLASGFHFPKSQGQVSLRAPEHCLKIRDIKFGPSFPEC